MRSDFTPQVETREIDDSDLDNVSGGVLGLDAAGAAGPVVGTVDTLVPVSGTVSQVTGLASAEIAGVTGIAGL